MLRVTRALFLALAFGACASPVPDRVAEARAAARANLSTAEGKRYDVAFAEATRSRFEPLLRRCFEGASRDEMKDMVLLYRIDASGVPVEELAYPESRILSCLQQGFRGFSLPPPPKPDYWVQIELLLDEQ